MRLIFISKSIIFHKIILTTAHSLQLSTIYKKKSRLSKKGKPRHHHKLYITRYERNLFLFRFFLFISNQTINPQIQTHWIISLIDIIIF